MCGRFVAATPVTDLARLFAIDTVALDESSNEPNYNVTPRTEVLAIRERIHRGKQSTDMQIGKRERVLSRLRWGLVPAWANDVSVGDRMINARLETVAEKPAFRSAFALRRCIIPVTGFYEWQVIGEATTPKGRPAKHPMYIHRRDDQPLAFAGLWEISDLSDHQSSAALPSGRAEPLSAGKLRTCSIITTEALGSLAEVHHRMPVILPPSAWSDWLDRDSHDPAALFDLVNDYPSIDQVANEFDIFPVSTRINRPDENSVELIAPVA